MKIIFRDGTESSKRLHGQAKEQVQDPIVNGDAGANPASVPSRRRRYSRPSEYGIKVCKRCGQERLIASFGYRNRRSVCEFCATNDRDGIAELQEIAELRARLEEWERPPIERSGTLAEAEAKHKQWRDPAKRYNF